MPVVVTTCGTSWRSRAAVPTVGTPVPWTGTVGATKTPNGMPKPAHAGASEPPRPRTPAGALVHVVVIISAPSLLGLVAAGRPGSHGVQLVCAGTLWPPRRRGQSN